MRKGKGKLRPQDKKDTNSGQWDENGHTEFLKGVVHFGWGKWSAIAKVCCLKRTRAQVATHANKRSEKYDKFTEVQK